MGILEENDVGRSRVIIQLLNNVGKALTQCSKTSSLFNKKSKVSSSADCYTSGHHYQLIILPLFTSHRSSPKGVTWSLIRMCMRKKRKEILVYLEASNQIWRTWIKRKVGLKRGCWTRTRTAVTKSMHSIDNVNPIKLALWHLIWTHWFPIFNY